MLSESEVDKGGDICCAELKDKLHHDDENQKFKEPWKVDEAASATVDEICGKSMGHDNHKQQNQPYGTRRGKGGNPCQ